MGDVKSKAIKQMDEVLDKYVSKRVVLADYIEKANEGFIYKDQTYISTSDEELFFKCGTGDLIEIGTKQCAFTWDSEVFPVNVRFSIDTPEKYLKKR